MDKQKYDESWIGKEIDGFTVIAYLGYKLLPGKQHQMSIFSVKCNNCGSVYERSPSRLRDNAKKQVEHRKIACRNCCGNKKGESGLKRVFDDYQRSAKKRKIEFALSLVEFETLTSSSCQYCGSPPSNLRKGGGNYRRKDGVNNEWFIYVYNGIDRIDSAVGYKLSNCVAACTICNHAKTDMTQQEFEAWLDRLIAHRQSTPYRPRPLLLSSPLNPYSSQIGQESL